jgi:DNA mismatch repair ATPase MutL
MIFSKSDLTNVSYLGQYDYKFLIYQSNGITNCKLFIIDQHGAHERIQLENLLNNYVYNLNNTILPTITIYKNNEVHIDINNEHFYKEINQVIKEMEHIKVKINIKGIYNSRIVFVIESVPSCIFNDSLFNECLNIEPVCNFIKAMIMGCFKSTTSFKSVEMLKLIRDFACNSNYEVLAY